MTTLVLSVLRGPVGIRKETRHVSSGAFQIGRAPPSDWVLDDPDCLVSKRHCVFRQDEDGWSVADVSRNGSFLASGARTVRLSAQPQRLASGQRLRFGAYEFAVELQEDEGSFAAMPFPEAGGIGGAGGGERPRMPAPPDVPPIEPPPVRPPPPRFRRADDDAPTRMFLDEAAAPVRSSYGLSALLEGASLAPDDVSAPGRETDVLRSAGAALRATIAEIRRLRLAMLGEANETIPGGVGANARPVAEARSDRDALRWLLAGERRYDMPSETVIEAAFAEFRQHHDCLVRAARQSARAIIEGLDPDEPERAMLPRWFDVIPGWRRARSATLARRRYRRLRNNLDRVIDQALARAYLDIQREADARWRPR